ncbi:putative secreted protein (Por secretion system target) [Chitinophaga niastensis]|uniref:Putative secreted protein (Por secretion system target) n=1 Tax=Chitinophaga niastensis TaxID=536980 RepID=A0A2P8HUW9_CHINA|nr:DUF1501 domain-containing protein [Chitinophaga niastensis]PSL50008.1 putative secreted protein (Por secretion system target) [Chitinophaga niastensis]
MKRRDFLKYTAPAAILPTLINGFSIKAFGTSPMLDALNSVPADNDHVLVMIQLTGGNDGLNMVVPLDVYGKYQAARNNIAIAQSKVLKLDNYLKSGLHPAMTGIQQLYNDGKVSIIQSVGYPSPNFSHFRATDIWLTGSDSNEVLNDGWGGRYLDTQYPGFPDNYPNADNPDPLAIQIGSIVSPAFQGPNASMGIAITSATDFYNLIDGVTDPVPNTKSGKELAYIRLIAKQTNSYEKTIKAAAAKVMSQGAYPANNGLAEQLKIVARLVAGGLKTRLYMVSTGGFDTHANQTDGSDTSKGGHAGLLGGVSDAIKAFMDDLKGLHASRRVVGMTFSEFGRRIKSNYSMGTDHGAAAPMIIFGDYVNQGVLGNSPSLPDASSVIDNIPMQYDFRSIYASLLEQWFCVDQTVLQKVLQKDYQRLPLISGVACGVITGLPDLNTDGKHLIVNSPNPFTTATSITYITGSGNTMIQIFDTTGRLVSVPINKVHTPGTYTFVFDAHNLPSGIYYARFQNGPIQQVRPMLKVN